MPSQEIILSIKNLKKDFIAPDGHSRITVLKNISLDVKKGDTIAVVGPSGSGKSTLLNLIGALDKPDAGHILLNDKDLTNLNDKELSVVRNKDIGFVFQLHHLLPQCSVIENVLIPTLPFPGNNQEFLYHRALELLKRTGLNNRINHLPGQLSGGELQRTALVRALINNPKILLADEPTGSLDNQTAEEMMKLIIELNKEYNTTVLLVTHSMDLAEKMKYKYKLHNNVLKQVRD